MATGHWENGIVGGHWVVDWDHRMIQDYLAFADAASQEYADRKAALAADVAAGWDGQYDMSAEQLYYFEYGGKTAEELYGPVAPYVEPEPLPAVQLGGAGVGDVVTDSAGQLWTVVGVDLSYQAMMDLLAGLG